MLKRSVEGMPCTAESGIYLLAVCTMLRHLCSPWHSTYGCTKLQGSRETGTRSNLLVKMHWWDLNGASLFSTNWNLARNMRSKSSEIRSYSPCILQWINITHNWSKTAHFTASPNGTISHWLNNCKAKLKFPRYWTHWVDQETAWMLGKQLSLWWGSRGFPVLLPTFCLSKAQPARGHRRLSPVQRGKPQLADVLWALQKLTECTTERTSLWKGSSESLSRSKLLDIQFIHCWEGERLDSLEPVALTSPDVLKHVNLSLPE